jgi:hypothetical protein
MKAMAKHRSHSIEFKRQVAQEYIAGETLHALSGRSPLMGLSRSTYYDKPSSPADDGAIVAAMIEICDEFENYGYRRVGAELRHRGMAVNSKKVRRLMRQHDLQPKRRKRFVATTDSDHDGPIFPDLVRDRMVDGPNQVWVADITYIAIVTGFVYLAAISMPGPGEPSDMRSAARWMRGSPWLR